MKKNMGTLDRTIRLILAGIFILLWFQQFVTGVPGGILLVLAAIFAFTSIFGYCPLYSLMGINSCGKEKPLQ